MGMELDSHTLDFNNELSSCNSRLTRIRAQAVDDFSRAAAIVTTGNVESRRISQSSGLATLLMALIRGRGVFSSTRKAASGYADCRLAHPLTGSRATIGDPGSTRLSLR